MPTKLPCRGDSTYSLPPPAAGWQAIDIIPHWPALANLNLGVHAASVRIPLAGDSEVPCFLLRVVVSTNQSRTSSPRRLRRRDSDPSASAKTAAVPLAVGHHGLQSFSWVPSGHPHPRRRPPHWQVRAQVPVPRRSVRRRLPGCPGRAARHLGHGHWAVAEPGPEVQLLKFKLTPVPRSLRCHQLSG